MELCHIGGHKETSDFFTNLNIEGQQGIPTNDPPNMSASESLEPVTILPYMVQGTGKCN